MVNQILSDARLALRGMLKRKGSTALLVLTLGLGLGANAAIFGTLDAMLVHPLDFPNVDRLVRVWETAPDADRFFQTNISPANFLDWQAQSQDSLQSLLAVDDWSANLRGLDAPEKVEGLRVSPSFFEALGVKPELGRGFLEEEGLPGRNLSAVMGHDLWQRSFAGDRAIVGRTLVIDEESYTVVGVAPQGFKFNQGTEIWIPLVLPAAGTARRDQHYLSAIGVLKPGRSIDDARRSLALISKRLETDYPDTNKDRGARVETLARGFEDQGLRPILVAWQVSALLVLLIACVNVASFLLARGAERQHELSLRLALGAKRSQILAQLLTEGVVTALLSLVVALPLGAVGAWQMKQAMPAAIARFLNGWEQIGLDWRMASFTFALALISAGAFALIPAIKASRPQLTSALKDSGRNVTTGGGRQRGRNILVVAQVAAALSLLVIASLAVKSAQSIIGGPQGYNPDGLLAMQIRLPEKKYATPLDRVTFVREVQAQLGRIPGARGVAFANVLPSRNNNSSRTIQIEGEPEVEASRLTSADVRSVSPDLLDTLGIPLLSGRQLNANDDDSADAAKVAVVSRAFVNRYWPGRDPLGRRFQVGGKDDPWLTVVGVCGDVIHHWFDRRNAPTFYRPYPQDPRSDISFVVRTDRDPESLSLDARKAVAAVDPYQPAYSVWSMRRSIANATIGLQYVAGIMSIFGVLAVVLALSGVYGVMSYRVSLRGLEIGVRMALGASATDVLRLTMGQAFRLTALGLGLGAVLGLLGARSLSDMLGGAVPFDSATFAGFTLLLAGAALFAAYVPARRALSVDPARALRSE